MVEHTRRFCSFLDCNSLFFDFVGFFLLYLGLLCVFDTRSQASCLHHENSTMTDFMRTRIQRESKSNSLCTMKYKRFFSFYFISLCFYVSFVIIEMATRIKRTNTFARWYTNRLAASDKDKHISCIQWAWCFRWNDGKRQSSITTFSTAFEIVQLYDECTKFACLVCLFHSFRILVREFSILCEIIPDFRMNSLVLFAI